MHLFHTSPEGDLLLLDPPITAALFVPHEDVSAFLSCPKTTRAHSYTKPIEIETFRLAAEFGFSFQRDRLPDSVKRADLNDLPVLRLTLSNSIQLLLIPAVLLPNDIIPLLREDPSIGVVVSHTLAMPRRDTAKYALRISGGSFRRRRPSPDRS